MFDLKSFFRRKASGNIAKKRLKQLLMSDRIKCSPDITEHIYHDLLMVLKKYTEIDSSGIDIRIVTKDPPVLIATIPFKSADSHK